MTLATTTAAGPYCTHLFYLYLPERNLFVFASDPATRHAVEALENPLAAASIVLESSAIYRLQGAQLTGKVHRVEEENERQLLRNKYVARFPCARMADLTLWTFEPDFIKLTDNRLGFGKKIIWRRDA